MRGLENWKIVFMDVICRYVYRPLIRFDGRHMQIYVSSINSFS